MGMAPYDFFYAFVLENVEEFRDETSSIRRAFNAAVSAFQLADHVFAYYHRHGIASFMTAYARKPDYLRNLCA